MQVEWDDDKHATNLAKHGVSVDVATQVWAARDASRQERRRYAGE